MTPAELSRTVVRAVRSAVDEGVLCVAVPDDVKVERPRPGGGGDYASAVALKLAAASGLAPRAVAEALRGRLTGAPGVARVEITGPGFLNFTLDAGPAAHDELVRRVLALGPRYGYGDSLAGQHTSFAPADEPRALAVTSVVVELLRSQGATAEITPYGSERIHVLPDPLPGAGPDAARWAYLRAAAHDRPAPAAELLAQRDSNSYFRVRYAYTRTRALTRNAHDLGFTSAPGDLGLPEGTPGGPGNSGATHLHRLLADHPDVLLRAARLAAPDRVARQLEGVADAVLDFQHSVLPLGDEKPLAAHRARLALAEAAGAVLAGGLSLFGIDAPEFL
ncbi:ArgS-related anticodon-binding protein NrtL [Streptomyces sp. BPTC-684]|uniref:ArgS-related anticodon-binding protein NrtL n=1 Tax=Streptomyces sp. BPTC-684 TaxID=3043734 RepID=UPI0024B1C464|nr:DALR anticodon-binding domain-containing protein [Streptomyces sp. BPTC-684]WHM36596.1 DALR anticodon-binding domain-containing protein [Streptomyces sp. BPTC-684]